MRNRTYVAVGMLCACLHATAQLSMVENGNIAIKTTATPLSPLSLNHGGNADYFLSYSGDKNGSRWDIRNGGNMGYELHVYPTGEGTLFIGTRSRVETPVNCQGSPISSYGIQGGTQGATYNYGMAGSIGTTNKGAAVMGVVGAYSSSLFPTTRYAGYFIGNVKVTGSVLAGSIVSSAPMAISSNPESGKNEVGKAVTSRLREIEGISYYTSISSDCENSTKKSSFNMFGDVEETEDCELTLLEKQDLEKVHHGLDVKQLSEAFPELVYDLEDGGKAINYVEMIPLLVQAVNELTTELEELRGSDEATKTRSGRHISPDNAEESFRTTAAHLYQNAPNPFTERTEIRFSVPEGTNNAYIYIFDMTGKMLRQILVDSSMQSVTINGYELSAGIYLYSLVINGKEIDTKRMILSK